MGSRSLRPTGFYPTTWRLGLPLYCLPKLGSEEVFHHNSATYENRQFRVPTLSKSAGSDQSLAVSVLKLRLP